MSEYRSKGVHTNRKGGKSPRKAIGRDGKAIPVKPRPTTAEKIGKLVDGGAKKPRTERQQRLGGAMQQAGSDLAAQTQQAQAEFSAGHDRAVEAGGASMASKQASTPGKAAAIIKNRRA